MPESLDALHLRFCGCDEWNLDLVETDDPTHALMAHVVEPLLEQVGKLNEKLAMPCGSAVDGA